MAMPRHYISESLVPFEEDETHELKGHRSMCIQDLTYKQSGEGTDNRPSRQPMSRTICAFLNTGKGGTIYSGIRNDGLVTGIHLTQYQKDHVKLAFEDVLKRFTPPVPNHMVSLTFVPVFNVEDISVIENDQLSQNSCEVKTRLRPHALRTSAFCWCDNDASAQLNSGIIASCYIIEIKISAWNKDDPKNQNLGTKSLNLHPFFENEEGVIYFRNQASLSKASRKDVFGITSAQVRDHYANQITKLRDELTNIRAQKQSIK